MASTEAQKASGRERSRRYYERHREEIALANQNPVVRAARLEATARHKARNPTAVRDWKAAHKAEISEANKAYYRRRGQFVIRMREYGLTQEQFEHMLVQQDNACAICRMTFGQTKSDAPHVDHDHASGRVRALLCINCNFLIGHCREDPALLAAAGLYLQAQKEI